MCVRHLSSECGLVIGLISCAWCSLVTAAPADTAALISGGVGGAPQLSLVPQPLVQASDLGDEDTVGGVSSPSLVRS